MAPERSPKNFTTTTTAFTELMDNGPKYEKTIAGKLQSLPVPDMTDAIWSRIEAQLDIDLPTNDGGGNTNPPSSPSGPGIIGWGLSAVVIALITIFLLSKNKSEPTNNNQTSNPVRETIQQPVQTINDPPPQNNLNTPPVIQTDDPVIDNTANRSQDSLTQQPITGVSIESPDSSVINKNPPLVTAPTPTTKDSLPAGKKRRGVTGLTDNDYRIEPTKKDD